MTIVRISIRKTLTGGLPAYHRTGPFASEYLVRLDAPFPGPQLNGCARRIARAESRLYPACVRFDLAVVKLATPGASGEELRGQFSRVGLDKLQGQVELGEDEALAFPPVFAVYARNVQIGRGARMLLPYVLCANECNLYVHKREVPLRFRQANPLDPLHDLSMPGSSFEQELLEAVHAGGGTYVMPGILGEDEGGVRRVRNFVFQGFQAPSSRRKKKRPAKSIKTAALRAAASAEPVEGVVYLLRAGPYYKIGKSISFEKRLSQIKLQMPDPVEVVHIMRAANPTQAETYWHRRFVAKRRNGEWFLLSDAEIEEFKSVSQM